MKAIAAFAVALLAVTGAQAQGGYWSDDPTYAANPGYAQSMALCRAAKPLSPPAADKPDAATAKALKGCSSEALYYGIGRPADPAKARQCAFVEAANPDEGGMFSGKAMLMTIYANGVGAKRDLDLAIHYACDVDGAPMEYDGRVRHLAELKSKPGAEPFDFCDDITSGLAQGYCASHAADMAGSQRDAKLKAMIAGWTPAERAAYAPLKAKFDAYLTARADNEIDVSGSGRAAFIIEAEEGLKDEFLAVLQGVVSGKVPRLDLKTEDAKLNAAYKAARAVPAIEMGTVTPAGILAAQRAWLPYRDAFVAFAKVKAPGVSRDALAAWLTAKRTKLLSGEED